MLVRERSLQLNRLLGLTIAELDIPSAVRAAAVAEYQAVAAWLRDWWAGVAGEIYPQGSIRLGTMVSPITEECDYDIDLVCRLWLTKEISRKELKRLVGMALREYVSTRPSGTIRLKEGKRCWTLVYVGQRLHMDVLPAIPNEEHPPHGIWLTDRELTRWQASNPIRYAEWFALQMETQTKQLLEAEAVARDIDVEDVPPESVKTTLQQSVQALKRHRDLHFAHDAKLAPASIIPTTLAGRAYAGGENIYEVLVDLTERMPGLVEHREGTWIVANPVLDDENFADRWNSEPKRAVAFFDWIEAAHRDFAHLGAELQTPRLIEGLMASLGDGPAQRAGRRYAADVADLRTVGKLRTGQTGLLGTAGATVPNRRHTFHGTTRAGS